MNVPRKVWFFALLVIAGIGHVLADMHREGWFDGTAPGLQRAEQRERSNEAATAETANGSVQTAPVEAVLALSWQPAFCETAPRKPECRDMQSGRASDRFDASHFALHGLWPQPRDNQYCGPEGRRDERRRWSDLPEPDLPRALKASLDTAMPGTRSNLHRHEWSKHGTCYSPDARTYYEDSLALLGAVNESPVRELFASSRGRELAAGTIRAAFDRAFGQGAGDRVRLACRRDGNRRVITEVTVSLRVPRPGRVRTADLPAMIASAPPRGGGCPGGIVDPPGNQ